MQTVWPSVLPGQLLVDSAKQASSEMRCLAGLVFLSVASHTLTLFPLCVVSLYTVASPILYVDFATWQRTFMHDELGLCARNRLRNWAPLDTYNCSQKVLGQLRRMSKTHNFLTSILKPFHNLLFAFSCTFTRPNGRSSIARYSCSPNISDSSCVTCHQARRS